MTPAAPDLPVVTVQHRVRRPVLKLASGFAAVLLFVGVRTAFLVQSQTNRVDSVGGAPIPTASVADSPVIVVFFSEDFSPHPATVVEQLRSLPEVADLLVVDLLHAERDPYRNCGGQVLCR